MLYPLVFEPIYFPKVWGGRRLEILGRDLPDGSEPAIGESWELADLAQTDPSGGGGEAARSVVANGPLEGRSIHELIAEHGQNLIGTVPLTESGDFPLLVKFLDARQNLSVQVHPSPAYAAKHKDAHLKSEAWYVVDADPGAAIYKGVQPGVSADQFRRAVQSNRVEQVEPLLQKVAAKPGDCHYLPSGTVHALGAGVVVAEVQTPSDTTFRVFDWGRTGRELHVEQAMASMVFEPVPYQRYQPNARLEHPHGWRDTLVHCEYFRLERLHLASGTQQPLVTNHQPGVWIILEGEAEVTCRDAEPVTLSRGRTYLMPAEMTEPSLRVDEALTCLEVTFPQAMDDVIA